MREDTRGGITLGDVCNQARHSSLNHNKHRIWTTTWTPNMALLHDPVIRSCRTQLCCFIGLVYFGVGLLPALSAESVNNGCTHGQLLPRIRSLNNRQYENLLQAAPPSRGAEVRVGYQRLDCSVYSACSNQAKG